MSNISFDDWLGIIGICTIAGALWHLFGFAIALLFVGTFLVFRWIHS